MLFERDELVALHKELSSLGAEQQVVAELKKLVVSAIDNQIGIETIAD